MALILIVDDNDMNLKLFEAILTKFNYEVASAKDGLEAIEKAKELLPDLILLDIQMPAMDGYETIKILKNNDTTKNIPVFACTSFAMKGDEEKCLSAGFDDYISKPINVKEFANKIKMFLEGSKNG